mmetsp:Transcript_22044/g.46402  ORF Transcript_22044/g.46402 Transcript_22044/m.46402 type:complete len:84 (+) Transcript_22044:444-695(+)
MGWGNASWNRLQRKKKRFGLFNYLTNFLYIFCFSLVSHFHLVSFFNFPLLYSTLDNINGDESFKLFFFNRISKIILFVSSATQ